MPVPVPVALHHACYIVEDLEGTARRLSKSFGIGPWTIWTLAPQKCVLHGRDARFSFRIALATVGGGVFELVSPLEGPSVYREYLAERGDGFHHVCFTYASAEEVLAVKDSLRREGREIVQEGSTPGVFEWAYVQLDELASAIEILWVDMAKLAPPSGKVG